MISRGWRFGLQGSEKSEEVGMTLSIQLLLFLELTLQGREIIPEPLI